MKHTISILVEEKFNALSRIVGLFSGRGYRIDTITVGGSERPGMARITLTTRGDNTIIEQIIKQLHKLVDVLTVTDLTDEPFVSRELALAKVSSSESNRLELMQIADIFRGNIVDMSKTSVTVEITGKTEKIDAALEMLENYGLIEVARTGCVALKREYRKNSAKLMKAEG